VRLVLKFLGAEVAVFDEWMHVDDGTWRYLGESAEWDLSCRDWVRVEQPATCCRPWTPEEIADTDSMLRHLAAGMPPPPEGTDEWAAEKAAARWRSMLSVSAISSGVHGLQQVAGCSTRTQSRQLRSHSADSPR
jgi:hypothetical protein